MAQDEKNYNRFGTIPSVNALGPDGAQLLTENSSGVLHLHNVISVGVFITSQMCTLDFSIG